MRFRYKAYDGDGRLREGAIEASDRPAALEALRRGGLYPVDAAEGAGAAPMPRWWQQEVLGPWRPPNRELAVLFRELATLIDAEVAVDEALRILVLQPMRARMRRAVEGVLTRVLEGAALSEALAAAAPVFPAYCCSMVRAGEASGALGPVLADIAAFLERAADMRGSMQSALVYPALLLAVAVGVIGLIGAVLVPTLAPLFEDAGRPPPLLVRVVLSMRQSSVPLFAGPVLLLVALGIAVAIRDPRVRGVCDRALLRIPFVGGSIVMAETARLARVLSVLLRSGVPLLEALAIARDVVGNRAVADALGRAAGEVREGAQLPGALNSAGLLPPLAIRLVTVGAGTGRLEAMLAHVALLFEGHLKRRLDRLTSLLAPLLTIVVGVIVAGLLLSVMSAIAGVNELALR